MAGPGSRIAVAVAMVVVGGAAVLAQAPSGSAIAGCGTNFTDFRGGFTAEGDPQNSLQFDEGGGITFHSVRFGTGEGIYAVIPTGGFTAALRLSDKGEDIARIANATSMVKSTAFVCAAPGTQVTTFTSLDQSSRRLNYVRTS